MATVDTGTTSIAGPSKPRKHTYPTRPPHQANGPDTADTVRVCYGIERTYAHALMHSIPDVDDSRAVVWWKQLDDEWSRF